MIAASVTTPADSDCQRDLEQRRLVHRIGDERPRLREVERPLVLIVATRHVEVSLGAPWQFPEAQSERIGWTSSTNRANAWCVTYGVGSKSGGSAVVQSPSPSKGGVGGGKPFSVAPLSSQLMRVRYASEPFSRLAPPTCGISRGRNSSLYVTVSAPGPTA